VSASVAETRGPAHGAGCWVERSACPWPRLSLLVASGNHIRRTGLDAIPVGKLVVSLANRRGLRMELRIAAVSPRTGDCSRVLTRFLKVKPTTAAARSLSSVTAVTGHALPKTSLRAMWRNGWRLRRKLLTSGNAVPTPGRRQTNEARKPDRSRAHRVRNNCDEPTPAAFSPVDNRAAATVFYSTGCG
jgi:hypothetical protein